MSQHKFTKTIVRSLALVLSLSPIVAIASQAPDFTLPGLQQSITLSEYRGKVVYVDFWASWCAPCRKSFPWMNDLQTQYKDNDLRVIAVNLDAEQDEARKFVAYTQPTFDIAFDSTGSVAQDFKVIGMPSSYIIDRQGNIVYAHVGFRSKDKAGIESKLAEMLGAH